MQAASTAVISPEMATWLDELWLASTTTPATIPVRINWIGGNSTTTGVTYAPLADAISRAVHLYQDPTLWTAMQRNGMTADFSWARSGAAYADLYKDLTAT